MEEPKWWSQVKDSIEGKLGNDDWGKIVFAKFHGGNKNLGVNYPAAQRNYLFKIDLIEDKEFLIINQ